MENVCPKGKELLASLAPGFLDPLLPEAVLPHCNKKSPFFKPAIVSDMSEITSLNSSELVSYLEFQPTLIKKVVETLRNMEQELVVKDKMLKSVEKVKDELSTCKNNLSESAVVIERLRSEKSQVEMEKSKALTELEIYKSRCNELSEKVVELTKYKVGLDDLIEKFTPNRQLKRNEEHEEGEVNKKRKLADEPPATPHVQANEYPTKSESSDDSSESDSSETKVPASKLREVLISSEEGEESSDEEMVPASKLREVLSSSDEGEESSDEVSMRTCHQCSKELPVLECTHCKKTRYCFSCIKNWYPQMSHKEIKKMCPCCRGNCQCRLCVSRVGKSKEEINLGVKLMDAKRGTYHLTRATIARYFYMPIEAAAKEMNIGCSFLKKRCRKEGIRRWPYRKLMSLQILIKKFQEMELQEDVDKLKIRGEIELLEKQMKLIVEMPDVDLEVKTKKLRQSCSKMNYMK